MADSHAIPPPPTPVMLYIGAGYDLSPLLTFAPGGSPYPIVPLTAHENTPAPVRDTYTSFVFVDAKPRHTSAYMVEDFDEWTSIEARVRNVMRYAQGKLDRYRIVDTHPTARPSPSSSPSLSPVHEQWDAPSPHDLGGDLIWFEGGGDHAHITARRADPAWHFVEDTVPSSSTRSSPDSTQPLTTLLYLFNTLDVELASNPYLGRVWPRVEALYVHGLRVHKDTGLKLGGGDSLSAEERGGNVGGLKRCYVIVGSWGTPRRKGKGKRRGAQRGVRDVDFVKAGRKRWRAAVVDAQREDKETAMDGIATRNTRTGTDALRLLIPAPSTTSRLSLSTLSSEDISSSPLIFRRPQLHASRATMSSGVTTAFGTDLDVDGDGRDDEEWGGDWQREWEEPVACAERVRALAGAFRGRADDEAPSPLEPPSPDVHPSFSAFPSTPPRPLALDLSLDFGAPFAVDIVVSPSDVGGASTPALTSPSERLVPASAQAFTPLTPPSFQAAPAISISSVQALRSSGELYSSALSSVAPPTRPPSPFHIRIPQLAWLDTLNDGRGGYYVAKTIEESLAVWRARDPNPEETEDEESDSDADDGEESAPEEQCVCEECVAESREAEAETGAKKKVVEFLRVQSTGAPRRPRTAPPRLRLRPRAPTPAPLAPSRPRTRPHTRPRTRALSTPDHTSSGSITSLSNSASETEVSDDEDEVRGGVAWWRWRRGVGVSVSAPLSLFRVGGLLRVGKDKAKDVSPKDKTRERRMDIADFLSTTSLARFPSPQDTPSTHAFTFPRSPYGPLSLDQGPPATETRSASCPNLKHAHAHARSRSAGASVEPQRARSISGVRIPLSRALSLGRKTPASAAPPPVRAQVLNAHAHHTRSTSSPSPRSPRGFHFRSAPDAPPVPPLPAHIPATPRTANSKRTPEDEREWDWLSWLLGAPRRRDRMGVDSGESDVTRVGG